MKIDIHSHILPTVDDGAKNIEESLTALKDAKNAGIQTIICTPHVNCYKRQEKEKIIQQFEFLREKAVSYGIHLFLGNEILLTSDMIEQIKLGNVFSLANTDYLLVEFKRNESMPFENVLSMLEELLDFGYKIILAHPEYYPSYRSINKMIQLKEQGVFLQIDATSILRKFHSKAVVQFTKKLIKENLADVVGSDIHQTNERNYRNYLRSYKKIKKKYGKKKAKQLFEDSPIKL